MTKTNIKSLCGFIVSCAITFVLLSGCSVFSNHKKAELGDSLWWGSKTEIIDFLNSPEATAEKWIIQSLNG